MTLRPCFLVALVTLAACYRHDPLYCDDAADCADVPGRPFCDIAGDHPASDGIARTCIPDPAGADGPDAGAGLTVTATAPAHLQVGATIAIAVTVERAPGSTGPIDVSVASLPPGLTAPPLAIPSSMSTGTLAVTAAADAAFGPITLSLEAHDGTRSGRTDVTLAIVGVPGTQDMSFGDGGIAIVSVSDGPVMVQSIAHGDGFIGLLDNLSLVRVTADGVLDTSFGDAGRVRLDISGLGLSSIDGSRLVRGPDGDVVLVAHGPATSGPGLYHELIARVSPTGTIVLSPRLLHADASEDRACGAAVVQNGKVVVASRRGSEIRLKRYTPEGFHDRTFEPLALRVGWCEVVFAAPGGGVFARADQSALYKLDVAGVRDRTFGDLGVVHMTFEPGWTALENLPGEVIRIGGAAGGIGVWQLDRAGNPDTRFGDGGNLVFPALPNYSQTLFAMRETPEGSLMVAGKLIGHHSQGEGAVMGRMTLAGAADQSFGQGGFLVEGDRWSIDNAFLLDGRHALFVNSRAGGAVELRRFWY